MEKQFSYRITKIAGRAVAVAMSCMVALAVATSANAGDVWLGTSYSGVTPNDGATQSSATWWDGSDSWQINYTRTASYGVNVSRAGDIFYGTTATYWDGSLRPLNAQTSTSFDTYWNTPDTGYWVDAQRAATYMVNNFGNIVDGGANNYYFGVGTTVSDINRGEKASTDVTYSDWGTSGRVTFGFYTGSAAAQNSNGRAIDVAGAVSFAGQNVVNGTVYASGVAVNGNNVVFNGDIHGYNGTSNVAGTGVTLAFGAAGSAYLNGGAKLYGNVDFGGHNAVLNLSSGSGVYAEGTSVGSISGAGTNNSTLNFEGDGYVAGAVDGINAVNVKGAGSLVQLNADSGNTQVANLNYSADQAVVAVYGNLTGNVNMNGHYSKLNLVNRGDQSVQTSGMTGVLDFGMYKSDLALTSPDTYGKGTLEVGDNVNVTFSNNPANGIKLTNADNATVVFAGNSTVTGDLGSADASNHNTPYKIYAGATNGGTGGTVTFGGRVYVGAGNLNVGPSNNTVLLNGGLTGNLVFGTGTPVSTDSNAYSTYGDGGVGGTWGDGGTVKLADNQTITGSITTVAAGTGTMLFLGSSNYLNNIGADGANLAQVVFNSEANGAQTTIHGDVYANNVTIGNGGVNGNATTATLVSGRSVAYHLGDQLTLANNNTTLNLFDAAPAASTDGSGRLSGASGSRVDVGANGIATNNASINFLVDAGSLTTHNGSLISPTSTVLTTTGALIMSGSEKIGVTYLGSAKNGAKMNLISAASANGSGSASFVVTDNSSLVMASTVSKVPVAVGLSTAGLELTVSRTDYDTAAGTASHFSSAAAKVLSARAATGTNYSSDMQSVFNKLDLNQWGYGDTQAHLATQVKRLAPIANGSAEQAALGASTVALNAVGERLSVLRGDSKMAGTDGNGRLLGSEQTGWVKLLGGTSTVNSIGQYDGFKTNSSGLAVGADTKIENGVLGAMFSYANTSITQQDFRSGEAAQMGSNTLAVYGTQEYGEAYVDAALAHTSHSLDSNRRTAIDRVANAKVDFSQSSLKLGAGYRFAIDGDSNSVLTPMVTLQSDRLKQDAYAESGAGALALNVDGRDTNRTRISLGLRYNTSFVSSGTTFYPEFMVAANRNNGMRNTDVVASFAGDLSAAKFTTPGVELPRTSYTLGAGLRFATSKTTEVQLGYRYEGGSGVSGSTAQVRAAWAF